MACEKVLPMSFEETLTPRRSQWRINRLHGERFSPDARAKKSRCFPGNAWLVKSIFLSPNFMDFRAICIDMLKATRPARHMIDGPQQPCIVLAKQQYRFQEHVNSLRHYHKSSRQNAKNTLQTGGQLVEMCAC